MLDKSHFQTTRPIGQLCQHTICVPQSNGSCIPLDAWIVSRAILNYQEDSQSAGSSSPTTDRTKQAQKTAKSIDKNANPLYA